MKKLLFLTLLIALLGSLAAVITDYYQGPVESAGIYSAITGTAAGVSGDDVLSSALDIGFTFSYCGIDYTQVKMSSNGWLGIGTAMTSSNLSNALASTSVLPVVAPLWDDLSSDGMSYSTLGTAPDRVFVAQWQNTEWNYNGTAGQNFQVRLYEGSNKIELIYGAMITPNSPSASIGINMGPGGAGNFYSITPGAPMTWSTTTENTTISDITYLSSGVTYTFNQTVATAQPNPAALVAPADGSTGVSLNPTLSWMSGGGLPTDYNLYLDTVNPPVSLESPNQTGTTYNPATLAYNTNYYWKVDPHNAFGYASELHTLPVWSFTTASPPLTGNKIIGTTMPYDYPSFTAAIDALNGSGVGPGGVTFRVQGGTYAENPPVITVSGTVDDPIGFKALPGANPMLMPTGGTGSFGFKVDGGDHISFDDIDIWADGTLVYGYWFINGTDYINVQNCDILMPYVTTTNYGIRSYGSNHNCSFLNNTLVSNTYYGIYIYGTSAEPAQNTLVQGNDLTGIRRYGIYNNYAINTVIANNAVGCPDNNDAAFYGIYLTGSGSSATVYGNEVNGGSNSNNIYPIYLASGAFTVYGNKIHGFTYTAASTSWVFGIYIASGGPHTVYNNMIYDLHSPAGTSAPQIRALAVAGGTEINLWNNTVFLNTASGTSANFSSAALYVSSTSPTIDLRNNILVNTSTPGSTGRSVAFWKTSAGVGNFVATSNKNIYYAGTPDASHLIGYFSSTGYQTLDEYKTMAATIDQGSYTEDVPFVSTTRIIDPHINPAVATRVEGNAIPIQPPVDYDIDGDLRSAATPDIGADEGEFTPVTGAPGQVTLLSPADGALDVDPNDLVVSWTAPSTGGTPISYYVFIAESEVDFWSTQIGYAEVDVPATSLDLSTVAGLNLQPLTPYYWAVQAHNAQGDSDPDDPGFMIWSFTTMQRMTAPADLPLGNVWPESEQTGSVPVTNHGPVDLIFTATGPAEFEFGTTRFTVPRNSTYDLSYTFNVPGTTGPYTGQIILQETSPDPLTPPLNIAVTANVTTDVIVGDGTVDLDLPVNCFYGYTYSQTIYYPTELNYPAGYRIERLYYNYNGYENCESTKDWVIWMSHTTEDTFASTTSWIPVSGLTQVYAGENQPQQVAGGYWMEFMLNTPFIYNGTDNLVIAVDENTSGYDSSSSYFYCTNTTGVNRSIRYYNDTTNPDPAAPPTGTLIAGLPNTKFFVAPLPTAPVFYVSPDPCNFGQLFTTTAPVTQTITIYNTGAGLLGINNITYSGDAAFTLANLPTLPLDPPLSAGENATFDVIFNPATAGSFTGTVYITDNLARVIHELDVTGSSIDIAGGYHVANSFQTTLPSYPTYIWIDISATGTEITGLTDDGYTSTPIPLGMTFPFYGNDYTDVYVASNGFLCFGTGNGSLSNAAIPTATVPNNLIAWFWDDMNPASSTVTDHWVRYQTVDGNFVITFNKHPEYGGDADGWITAQVILFPSGKVKIQYAARGASIDMTGYTMGIEDSNGLLGIEYHFDTAGLDIFGPAGEPMAVAFGTGDLGDGGVNVPQNIQIMRLGPDVQLSWDAVPGATGYKVYGFNDPYAPTPWTLLSTVSAPATTATLAPTEQRKFYYVTAYTGAREVFLPVGTRRK